MYPWPLFRLGGLYVVYTWGFLRNAFSSVRSRIAKAVYGNSEQTPVTPQNPSRSVERPSSAQMFALIIGIDNYANCQKLRGAVADAESIRKYLAEALRVADDHMVTLYNDKATRSAIIAAFEALRSDQRIRNGDPIVIFFAGHGGELPPPDGWGPQSGRIQCLLSQDYKAASIHAIPDRTIGALIGHIAAAKGDNITVIFDCCHSASGTRAPGTEYVPRSVAIDPNVPTNLDYHIWGSRVGSVATGFAYHGLRSHVLLAACGEKELAYEHEGRGQFTGALLETLENNPAKDVTYTQLLGRIHLPKQNPQCEGVNRHRVLFDGKVPIGSRVYHSAHVHDDHKCVINAGLAHGVSRGAEFTLYNERNPKLSVVQVDETTVVGDFETTITMSEPLADISFARLTRVGKLFLRLAPSRKSSVLERTVQDMDGNSTKFEVVGNVEKAKLEVGMKDNQATFKILDQRVNSFGLTDIPHKVPIGSLAKVLDAATHFFWYFDLKGNENRISIDHEVAVDFYLLRQEYDKYGLPLLSPDGPSFCRKDSNNLDVIDFVVDPDALYGIEIKNNTSKDLYLNALLFNCSSLSIAPYYTQSTDGKPEPPLKQGESFSIGYGPGGTPPFAYLLEENQDIDVGYLKAFFATRPVDLSDVVQQSPFWSIGARNVTDPEDVARKAKLSMLPVTRTSESVHTWFTVDIPVVQRRKERNTVV